MSGLQAALSIQCSLLVLTCWCTQHPFDGVIRCRGQGCPHVFG